MIDVNTHEFRVDRVDNEDGTHTILIDHVQVGPPIPWDDTLSEHMVRQTCLQIQRGMRQNDCQYSVASPVPIMPNTFRPEKTSAFIITFGDPPVPAPNILYG